LRQFDSIVLLAGSTGATFTVPILRDIIQGWKENASAGASKSRLSLFGHQTGAVTRHIRFVWVVKSRGQLGWFSEKLSTISTDFQVLQSNLRDIKLELTIYVTCDESFTEEHKSLLSSITSPQYNAAGRSDAEEHGSVQYRNKPPAQEDKEKKRILEKDEIHELTISSSSPTEEEKGLCKCKSPLDESNPPENTTTCHCASSLHKSSSSSDTLRRPCSSLVTSNNQNLLVHACITVYSGRPATKDIIRRSLEQARGESAVVACGPRGLVEQVKQEVCCLSDERAVHKGTGAQGIYLHTESFNY
jgi:hypothetical protein